MKYAITGAAGNISKPLVKTLLRNGHDVTVIGRNKENLQELIKEGANPAIGSVADATFVKEAFRGVDAVYAMFPPIFDTTDLLGHCENIARNYKESIEHNNVRYVVHLSSVGAHLDEGAGHITTTNRAEKILNSLSDVNIKHLRPVFFYTNLFAQFGLIRNMGLMGASFSLDKFPVVDPAEIAAEAADHFLALDFSGHSVNYIASDETSTDEIAAVVGDAIGKTGLKWIKFSDDQAFEGFVHAGFSKETAREFVQGFRAMHEGKIFEDYWKHRPPLKKTKLRDFAKTIALAWHQQTQSVIS